MSELLEINVIFLISATAVSHASVDCSPPLLNALKRDKDRKFTRIYHQSFNLQHFFRKRIIQLMAIVTATTGTLTS